MNEIEQQLKTLQFLGSFTKEIEGLIQRLRARYKDKPKEPAIIVIDTVASICGRLILGTAPVQCWEPILTAIIQGLAKEYKKDDRGYTQDNSGGHN